MSIDPVSLGIQAALMAAQMALGASRKIEGPRLDDLSVTLADYGTPLNYFKGACRFDGPPIFWKEDLREIKTRSKTKGGKYNDYRYTGSWANAIAAQAIDGVTRIFMDRHLVYDRTGAGPVTPFSIGYTQRTGKTGSGSRDVNINLLDHLRIYLGSETQMPDSRMLQEVEVRKGAGFCPAHRGLAYVLFEEIPLDKFGNRLPQLSVEAVSSSTPIYPIETYATLIPQPSGLWGFTFSKDYSRMIWGLGTAFEIWDVAARARTLRHLRDAQGRGLVVFGMYDDGSFLVIGELFPAVGNQKLYRIGADGFGASEVMEFVGVPQKQEGVRVLKDARGDEHFATIPWSSLTTFFMDGVERSMLATTGVAWKPMGYFNGPGGDIWAVGRITAGGVTTAYFVCLTGAAATLVTVSGLVAQINGLGNVAACFCAETGNFVLAWNYGSGGYLYEIDPATGTVLTAQPHSLAVYNTDKQFANFPPGASSIWLNSSEISLADLSTIRTVTLSNWLAVDADGIIFDPVNQALITAPQFTQQISWRYLDRISGAGVTLRTVVEHVSNLCGIDTSVLDASALTQSVPGYKWTRGSGKDVIEPLLELYAADCRPHGFGVQFINRGAVAGAVILSDSFAMVDADEPLYAFTTPGGSDVPKALTLAFSDIAAEFQTNNIYSKRPLDAVDGRGEITIDMTPLSITPAAARPLTDRLLRQYWIARKGWTHALTAEYIDLEPGDVRTLDLEGSEQRAQQRRTPDRPRDAVARGSLE